MPRDRNLVKRNLLAIPGALLGFYALVGLIYVLAYRGASGICQDSTRFLVAGACYGSLPFLALFLVVGAALLAAGLLVFRGRVSRLDGHLRPGTPTMVFLALLTSFAVVPMLTAAILSYVQGTEQITFATQVGSHLLKTTFLLWAASGVALTALVPSVLLVWSHDVRRRSFLRAARRIADQPDGQPASEPMVTAQAGQSVPPPEEFVDEALWPNARQ